MHLTPFPSTDQTLVAKALSGSQRAWTKLVRRYEQEVFNHALRMTGHHDDARDLTQDIFLAVFRNLPSFRGDARFRTWLYRIAKNRSIDLLRKRQKLVSIDTLGDCPELSQAGDVDHFHDNCEVIALLRLLSSEQRLILELKFFQQFTFEEIGAQMNTSSNTAKTRYYAALNKLKSTSEANHDAAQSL